MNDERTIAYLLDELPEHEALQFEEECFSQPEWPEVELQSAEDGLIQAYITNELSPDRRRRFEENYHTTAARIEKVLIARSAQQVMCQPKPTWTERLLDFVKSIIFAPQFTVPKFAAVLVTSGLVATIVWFSLRPTPPRTFAQINLAISYDNRAVGGPTQNVKLPLAEDALRVWLSLPESAPQNATYRVQWENKKGLITNLAVENKGANPISVIIPAKKLSPGQYALKLFRTNPDGTEERVPGNYFFNID